jgi:hypothetical protein
MSPSFISQILLWLLVPRREETVGRISFNVLDTPTMT